jgi:DGQHR domain-containing protein
MTRAAIEAAYQFENEVRQSLKRIGFKDVGGAPDFRVGGHQVDACGGWDDILLVVECTQSGGESASIHDLISEVRGNQPAIRHGFRRLEKYETYRRFHFAIITRNIRYTEGDLAIASHKPAVHLIDFQTINYYQKLALVIGPRGTVFNFLGELQVEPRDFDLPRVPALRVQLGRGLSGYLFWCDPQDLLKVAYVARRESGRGKYYQRMLTPQRLTRIKDFIQKGGIFPNNIIIAFDHKPQFRPKQTFEGTWPSWLEFGELIFPASYRSCWVVDGQHRLYAFGYSGVSLKYQKLAVFAFDPIKEHRQAKFFIEINREQKPVSPDLIWDLEGEMSPETPRGRIANCVKKLNSIPPLKEMIFQPLSGERKRGQLKMSGVCQDLEEIGFLKDRTRFMIQAQMNPLAYRVNLNSIAEKVATAIGNFLKELQRHSTPNMWDSILSRPGGTTLALNVYEQILIRIGQIPTNQQLEKYSVAFIEVLNELAPNQAEMRKFVRTQLTSYAQRRQISVDILGRMQEKLSDPEFAKIRVATTEPFAQRLTKFERRLAEVVTRHLGIVTIVDLKQKASEEICGRVAERMEQERKLHPEFALHEALTLGEVKEIIARRDNVDSLMPLFTDPVNGFGDEQAVLAALTGIVRARNATAHGRRMGNRRLVSAYLETFEDLIGPC